VVAEYHDARLAELVQRVGGAVDRFRSGELDAFEVDRVILQYSRAAKELRKFCNLSDAGFTATRFVTARPSTGGSEVRRCTGEVGVGEL
jgi:hypothetical protein